MGQPAHAPNSGRIVTKPDISAVTQIRLPEYQQLRNVPLSDQQAAILRTRFGRYLDVNRSWEGGWDIKARQFVGSIHLDTVHILIEPKVPLTNLFYMLTFAYDIPAFRQEQTQLPVSEDLFEFIVEIFVKQIQKLARQGIYRSYIDQEEHHRFLRGRLQLQQQLRASAVAQQFHQVTNHFTANNLENQILKYTLWQLSRLDYRHTSLRSRTRRLVSAFADTQLMPIGASDCERIVYTRLNRHYQGSITLARLLIQHLSLEGGSGDTPFAAYLFDMNQLFERFIARMLQQQFDANPNIQIHPQEKIWLDDEQQERGHPDLVLYANGAPQMVMDTKYKQFNGSLNRADLNQMVVYGNVMGLNRGVLIYPTVIEPRLRRTVANVKLEARGLALDGPLHVFQSRCDAFARQFVEAVEWELAEG